MRLSAPNLVRSRSESDVLCAADSAGAHGVEGFYVLSGRPTEACIIAETVRSVLFGDRRADACAEFGDPRLRVEGVPSDGTCARFWIASKRPDSSVDSKVAALANRLKWTAALRYGIAYGGNRLPPNPRALQVAQRKFEGATFTDSLNVFLNIVLAAAGGGAALTAGGEAERILACVAAVVALGAFAGRLVLLAFQRCNIRGLTGHLETLAYVAFVACPLAGLFARTRIIVAIAVVAPILLAGLAIVMIMVRGAKRIQPSQAALTRARLRDEFALRVPLGRTLEEKCAVCGYELRGISTCRCPECGTYNYVLVDREDARTLALKHGAVFGDTGDTH